MEMKVFGERTSSPEKVGTFHLDDCGEELVSKVLTKSQVLKGFLVLNRCTGDQDTVGWNSEKD